MNIEQLHLFGIKWTIILGNLLFQIVNCAFLLEVVSIYKRLLLSILISLEWIILAYIVDVPFHFSLMFKTYKLIASMNIYFFFSPNFISVSFNELILDFFILILTNWIFINFIYLILIICRKWLVLKLKMRSLSLWWELRDLLILKQLIINSLIYAFCRCLFLQIFFELLILLSWHTIILTWLLLSLLKIILKKCFEIFFRSTLFLLIWSKLTILFMYIKLLFLLILILIILKFFWFVRD